MEMTFRLTKLALVLCSFPFILDVSPLIVLYMSGLNIEQWTIGYGWRQNQEAELKIVEGAMSWSNQQLYKPPRLV